MKIELVNITFEKDRVQIVVQTNGQLTSAERCRFTELLFENYSDIAGHSCRNSKGPTFGDCIKSTSIPHILEHVILSELKETSTPCRHDPSTPLRSAQDDVRDVSASSKVFLGKTTKVSEEVAKIELNYYDDILTLQAITRATAVMNDLLNACKEKDI